MLKETVIRKTIVLYQTHITTVEKLAAKSYDNDFSQAIRKIIKTYNENNKL